MDWRPTEVFRRTPGSAGREWKIWVLGSPFFGGAQPLAQAAQNSVNRSLGGNSEVLVKVLGGRACSKGVHADKFAILADHGIPAPAHGGLDRDLDRGIADDRLLALGRLRQPEFQRGPRDHARRNAALGELLLGGDRDLDLGTRGEQ